MHRDLLFRRDLLLLQVRFYPMSLEKIADESIKISKSSYERIVDLGKNAINDQFVIEGLHTFDF